MHDCWYLMFQMCQRFTTHIHLTLTSANSTSQQLPCTRARGKIVANHFTVAMTSEITFASTTDWNRSDKANLRSVRIECKHKYIKMCSCILLVNSREGDGARSNSDATCSWHVLRVWARELRQTLPRSWLGTRPHPTTLRTRALRSHTATSRRVPQRTSAGTTCACLKLWRHDCFLVCTKHSIVLEYVWIVTV